MRNRAPASLVLKRNLWRTSGPDIARSLRAPAAASSFFSEYPAASRSRGRPKRIPAGQERSRLRWPGLFGRYPSQPSPAQPAGREERASGRTCRNSPGQPGPGRASPASPPAARRLPVTEITELRPGGEDGRRRTEAGLGSPAGAEDGWQRPRAPRRAPNRAQESCAGKEERRRPAGLLAPLGLLGERGQGLPGRQTTVQRKLA